LHFFLSWNYILTRNSKFSPHFAFVLYNSPDTSNDTPNNTDTTARRKKIMILVCVVVAGTIGTYIALSYLGIMG
jgi:hypothetical protein